VTIGGAALGDICGCLLGSTSLLFMDLEKADRLKRANELKTIFNSVLNGGRGLLGADRCTLFLFDADKQELWTRTSSGGSVLIVLPIDKNALACHAARSKELLNIPDAYLDSRFDQSWDKTTGYRTRAVLIAPIINPEDGALLGCIQAINKADGGAFSADDEKLAHMLTDHIAIFIDAIGGGVVPAEEA